MQILSSLSSCSSSVLASLKAVHETLSQERQKLQEVWETNNIHQSNTSAEVRFVLRLSSGFSHTLYSLAIFLMASFLFVPPSFSSSSSAISRQQRGVRPTGLLQSQIRLQSILMPAMTSSVGAPLRCLMNRDLVMEAPPTLSQRKDMVGTCSQVLDLCLHGSQLGKMERHRLSVKYFIWISFIYSD